jgi:hypothetical protein
LLGTKKGGSYFALLLLLRFYQSDQERPDHLSGLEALFISHAGYFPMEIVRYANAECFHCG